MATIINADTSNGLKLTSDTSGIIQLQSGGTTKATVNSSGLTSSGHVLQVVETSYKTAATFNVADFTATGVTASITPSSSSNKVLVMVNLILAVQMVVMRRVQEQDFIEVVLILQVLWELIVAVDKVLL